MKKVHIVGIIIIAIAIGAIVASLSNTSTYASFAEAEAHPNTVFHVVGKLDRSMPLEYNPKIDANMFTFYMKDRDSVQKKVILTKSEPQDFERSQQIVLIGKANGKDEFVANDVLMKCPSKYTDGKPQTTAANTPASK